MSVFSGIADRCQDAKVRIKEFFISGPELTRVHFNLGTGSRTINCHGWLPKQYRTDGRIWAGLLKVFSIAGIKGGWKDGAPIADDDVDLLEFALICVAEATASKRAAASRKRRAKA
jgi:hypothetical protein